MAYFIGWLIGLSIYGIIFGLITKYVAESKGYDGGFWWGFFLGIIGLLVVGFRPNIEKKSSSYSSSDLPAWASQSAQTSNNEGWSCICGAKNPLTLDYCLACRRSKSEGSIPKKICPHCGAGNKPSNTFCFACDKPLDETQPASRPIRRRNANSQSVAGMPQLEKVDTPSDYVDVLERLAKLREQGILTDEEFQQKKTEILAKM